MASLAQRLELITFAQVREALQRILQKKRSFGSAYGSLGRVGPPQTKIIPSEMEVAPRYQLAPCVAKQHIHQKQEEIFILHFKQYV